LPTKAQKAEHSEMLEAALRDLLATQLSVLDPGLTLVEIEKYIPK
jgi:hypothetical protein